MYEVNKIVNEMNKVVDKVSKACDICLGRKKVLEDMKASHKIQVAEMYLDSPVQRDLVALISVQKFREGDHVFVRNPQCQGSW